MPRPKYTLVVKMAKGLLSIQCIIGHPDIIIDFNEAKTYTGATKLTMEISPHSENFVNYTPTHAYARFFVQGPPWFRQGGGA